MKENMTTKLENLELEIAHYNNFKQYIPDYNKMDPVTLELLLQQGGLQVSTLFEQALSNILECDVVSKDTNDLSNGGDGKLSSARTYSYERSYGSPITNVSGKTGTLYIQSFERKQNKFYYFAIPNYAYNHISNSSNIEIPFNLDGTPRRRNSCNVNWWNFEVNSLKDFSKVKIEPVKENRKTVNANNLFSELFTNSPNNS